MKKLVVVAAMLAAAFGVAVWWGKQNPPSAKL